MLGAYFDRIKLIVRKCTDSVSKKTTKLIHVSVLEDGRKVSESRKYRDAVEKNVKIMDEMTFYDFLVESITYYLS